MDFHNIIFIYVYFYLHIHEHVFANRAGVHFHSIWWPRRVVLIPFTLTACHLMDLNPSIAVWAVGNGHQLLHVHAAYHLRPRVSLIPRQSGGDLRKYNFREYRFD